MVCFGLLRFARNDVNFYARNDGNFYTRVDGNFYTRTELCSAAHTFL